MTVIVACRKTGRMASDRKTTDGDILYASRKVYPIGRTLIGGAGSASAISKFLRWAGDGMKPKQRPKFTKHEELDVLLLNPAGLFVYDTTLEPDEVDAPFFAVGSGAAAALGALHAGATLRAAVEIAARINPECGCGVDVFNLPKEGERERKKIKLHRR